MSFLHTYLPSPILISFGPVAVHWYGLFMALGIAMGYAVARRIFWRAHMPVALLNDLFISLVLGGFAGARLYHVVNEFGYYWAHPLDIFAVWRGGLAIHGAMIGGLMVLCWFVKRHQTDIKQYFTSFSSTVDHWSLVIGILWLADLLAPSAALGQAIGRWGNYFRQELYGLPTNLPWGIPIDAANRLSEFAQYEYFHPVFLYESIWLLALFIVLLSLLRCCVIPNLIGDPDKKTNRKRSIIFFWIPACAGTTPHKYHIGLVFFLYLILAGFGRFFIEFLRIDPMPLVFGMRLQQLVSFALVIAGFGGTIWVRHLTRGRENISIA